jgi:hypothetical protein
VCLSAIDHPDRQIIEDLHLPSPISRRAVFRPTHEDGIRLKGLVAFQIPDDVPRPSLGDFQDEKPQAVVVVGCLLRKGFCFVDTDPHVVARFGPEFFLLDRPSL